MSASIPTRALALALGLLGTCLQADEWPLTGPLLCHDPTLIREGDTWYTYYTGAGLPSKSSKDGLAWVQLPKHFTQELPWWRDYAPKMDPIDIWAPDLHLFNGRYWLYYSVSEFGKNNSAIGLVSCSSLAKGDWRDEGFVIGSRNGVNAYNAIDPNLVIDTDGRPWLAFGSWSIGICIVQLDPATMKPKGEVTTLASRENGTEGPNISYRDGYYYLFVSIDRCCQGVASNYKGSYGRSRKITGPYLDKAGTDMLNGGGTILEVGADRWKGPGGGSVIQQGDSWIYARHAYDSNSNGTPALRIADLYWDADGWPALVRPSPALPSREPGTAKVENTPKEAGK